MSAEKEYGHYAWERVRYLTRTLSNRSIRPFHRKAYSSYVFEPGEIACCHGSIERAFSLHLQDLGIPLEPWEGVKAYKQPLRYCVVNQRSERGTYEVFLMTTFGQARTFEELGPIAQNYGVPVGGMNWFEDIPPIKTYPPSFGWEGKSFIFAIPSRTPAKDVIPSAMRWKVRLVPGELERLRKISHDKMMNTSRVHRLVRASIKQRHFKSDSSSSVDDEQDDFLPTEGDEEADVFDERKDRKFRNFPLRKLPIPFPELRVPILHDLFWLLKDCSKRIYNYSTYLDHRGMHRKTPIQLRLGPVTGNFPSLPKPYYSPCLRVNLRTISRILR